MITVSPPSVEKLSDAVWIDLVAPTDEERARVEEATKLRLPTKGDLEEIESSSRTYIDDGAFYLSTPVLETTDCLTGGVTALGFVLSAQRLVTLRYARIVSFDVVANSLARSPTIGSSEVFLKLLEAIVDHTADALEHANAQLESISHAAFHAEQGVGGRPGRNSAALREALRKLGRMADGISHVRGTLLGLGRIAGYVHENGTAVAVSLDAGRSNVIRGDIQSLNDYQTHLSNNVQFLLDATLGFISIEQNEIVKLLTVVSVVGVPPVLVAGIYGMNFQRIPELRWALGYPFALGLILLSVLLPVAWLKWRRWM